MNAWKCSTDHRSDQFYQSHIFTGYKLSQFHTLSLLMTWVWQKITAMTAISWFQCNKCVNKELILIQLMLTTSISVHGLCSYVIESIHVSKQNGPQKGFAPVVFNNQMCGTSMITRQHDGGRISQNHKWTTAFLLIWNMDTLYCSTPHIKYVAVTTIPTSFPLFVSSVPPLLFSSSPPLVLASPFLPSPDVSSPHIQIFAWQVPDW